MIKIKFQPFNLEIFLKLAVWKRKIAWRPQKCFFSGRLIWLENAYCGVAVWNGINPESGETVSITETQWVTEEKYFSRVLK